MVNKKKKNFVCSKCNKSFIDNAHLKDHEVKHTGVKSFVCELCNKRFARSGSLRVHARTHTGNVKEYVCTFEGCNKRFTSRSGFINHQKKHLEAAKKQETQIQPETESIPTSPDSNVNLVKPESIEEIEKAKHVFICPIPGCYKTFNSQSSLNFHTYRVHLGIDSSVCSKSRCIRLRESYLRQQIQIQKLKERIHELEALTALIPKRERLEFQHEYQRQLEKDEAIESQSEAIVVPLPYLEEEKPYVCGIPECGCRFSTYKLLLFHAKKHPDKSLNEILNNQLIIPEGRVHCPVLGCEVGNYDDSSYGPNHKTLSSYYVLKRHYRRVHQHKSASHTLSVIGNTNTPTVELLNDLIQEGAVVIQNATILSDVSVNHSNISVASTDCHQTITTHCRGEKQAEVEQVICPAGHEVSSCNEARKEADVAVVPTVDEINHLPDNSNGLIMPEEISIIPNENPIQEGVDLWLPYA